MGWFIIGLLLIVFSIVAFVFFRKSRKNLNKMRAENDAAEAAADQMDVRRGYHQAPHGERAINDTTTGAVVFGVAAGFLFLVGAFTIVMDSFVIVPARNVGVVNIFGNANSSVSNGFHWVQPWASVENVDTTNKPLQLGDDGNVDNGCTSVAVRLATQTTACQDVFVQWQVDPKGDANDLWKTYRGSNDDLINNIQNNVILPRLRSEMQKAFSTYDPLSVLQGGQLQDTTTLQDPVKRALTGDMPAGVLLLDVRFGQIHYDSATQNKINAYSQAVADTKIAQQAEQTAAAQAAANKALAADPSTSNPGVQFQNCMNLIASLAAKGQLQYLENAGLLCGQAGSTSVIVDTKRAA